MDADSIAQTEVVKNCGPIDGGLRSNCGSIKPLPPSIEIEPCYSASSSVKSSRSTKNGSKIRRKRGSSKESASSKARNSRYTELTQALAAATNGTMDLTGLGSSSQATTPIAGTATAAATVAVKPGQPPPGAKSSHHSRHSAASHSRHSATSGVSRRSQSSHRHGHHSHHNHHPNNNIHPSMMASSHASAGAAPVHGHGNSHSVASSAVGSDRTQPTAIESVGSASSSYRGNSLGLTPTKIVNDEYYKAMEEKLKHDEIMQQRQQQALHHHQHHHLISSSANSHASGQSGTFTASSRAPTPASLLGQLPWTEEDSDILRDQVAFWKNCLVDNDDRIPKDDVRDLLKLLYTVLRQETLSRSDRALAEISQKLASLQRLDLQGLIRLMNGHQHAGEVMNGKDVILLTGAVGSGKTTTLHFLAGTEFTETEVDGFIHLHPGHVRDRQLEDYKTACGREAVTRSLQVATVSLPESNEPVVICDTPGFGISATMEEELAYHYGMSNAIDRARRVKPVIVLNQELMGSCFSNLPDTLALMMRDLTIKTPRDFKALDYVFTHYEERHRSRLCQQFASLKHHKPPRPETGGKNDLFDDFVNDIILKTTPSAKLALPLSDSPREMLGTLWQESFVEEPRDYYGRTPASEKALKLLQLQLQITLAELRTALSREVYSVALNRMVTLDKLSIWFPQAKQAALLAKEAASRQVKLIWDWMAQEIGNANYQRALFRMEQMSDFGLIFPDAHDCFKHGHDLIWESLVAPMEDRDWPLTMERIGKLSVLAQQYTEASHCVKRGLRLLRKKVENVIELGGFKDGVSLLVPLSSLSAEDAPEAVECAKSILARLRDLMEATIARKDYSMAFHMIRRFSGLTPLYPQADEMANRGLQLCRQTLETSVAQGDYDSALFLVQHMQRLQLEFPQAEEIAQFGLAIFASTVEVLIQHKDYNKAISLMKKLGSEVKGSEHCNSKGLGVFQHTVESLIQDEKDYNKAILLMNQVREEVPGATQAHTLQGLGIFGSEVEGLIESKDYGKAISLIKQVTNEVPGSDECAKKGLGVFGNELVALIQSKDYNKAITLMNAVGAEVPGQGSNDCIQKGLRVFGNEVEILIESGEFTKAVALMKKLAAEVDGSDENIVAGLALLKLRLKGAVKQKDYETALDLIYEVNNLAKAVPHPQADACIEYAFNALEENILIAIDRQEYQSAINLMELLTEGESKLPLAKECTRVGIQVLKRNVAKAIEKKKYSPALEMIQQLSDKGHKIPEVGECSRRGLELLKNTAQQAITDKDYTTATEIITNLSELSLSIPEAKVCTLACLHSIVDHVTELRQAVEKTVEEISQIRDLKVFVAMLLKLKSQIERVMKGEPLRKLSVQIHYKKNFRGNEEEGDTNVLFVPQLYTSQAFCSDHIELLAGHVREKLPEFDVNDACMESLIRNRKGILSVMIRLKAAHKILQSCPGGEKASEVYGSTFEQFYALIDTVLAIAEESLKPPIDMRLFELQAWFLSVLIKGFIKDKIDVDSVERQQMEELEGRRKILMLQFEVHITEALEILAEPQFVQTPTEVAPAAEPDTNEGAIVEKIEGTFSDKLPLGSSSSKDAANPIASPSPNPNTDRSLSPKSLDNIDFASFVAPRDVLLNLCQRPELFKMILKPLTCEDVDTTIKAFDKSLVDFIGELVRFGETEYNTLLELAKSGARLGMVLERARALREVADKIELHISIPRSWDPVWVGETTLHQQRLLILKKRIELATDKLEATIKTESEIGFGAFVTNMASPFMCNGKWYEDVPTSFL